MAETRYAVLIGVNNYAEDPDNLPALRCPENDARGLFTALSDPEIGGFSAGNIQMYAGEDNQNVLMGIASCLGQATRDDLVLIYYSGHGKLDQNNRLHLATSNTTTNLLGVSSIPVATVKRLVDESSSEKIIWILDCCYSGQVGEQFKGGDVGTELQIASGGKGTYIITASTGIQVAKEQDGDDYSLFTKHLLEGLQDGHADQSQSGLITVDDLYRYTRDKVVQSGQQEPMKFAVGVTGDMVIAFANQRQTSRDARLLELFTNGDISADAFGMVVAMVNQPDTNSEDVEALISLVDGVLGGLESAGLILYINNLVGKVQEERKEALRAEASTLRHAGTFDEALVKLKGILELDSSDSMALKKIDEITQIIDKKREIESHQTLAESAFESRDHLTAMSEWLEVLKLDGEDVTSVSGIQQCINLISGNDPVAIQPTSTPAEDQPISTPAEGQSISTPANDQPDTTD